MHQSARSRRHRTCTVCGTTFRRRAGSLAKQCCRPCLWVAQYEAQAAKAGRKPDPLELACLLVECPVDEATRKRAEAVIAKRIEAACERLNAKWDARDKRLGLPPGTTRRRRQLMVPHTSLELRPKRRGE